MIKRSKFQTDIPTSEAVKDVIEKLEKSKDQKTDHYLHSYSQLVHGCQCLLNHQNLIAAGHLVYSWMPTILKKIDTDQANPVRHMLDNYRENSDATFDEVMKALAETQVPLLNNSWVGTSKLLHFAFPEYIPIWDSRVARSLGIYSYTSINNKESFLDYIDLIYQNRETTAIRPLKLWLGKNYTTITDVRALELYFFINGNS